MWICGLCMLLLLRFVSCRVLVFCASMYGRMGLVGQACMYRVVLCFQLHSRLCCISYLIKVTIVWISQLGKGLQWKDLPSLLVRHDHHPLARPLRDWSMRRPGKPGNTVPTTELFCWLSPKINCAILALVPCMGAKNKVAQAYSKSPGDSIESNHARQICPGRTCFFANVEYLT